MIKYLPSNNVTGRVTVLRMDSLYPHVEIYNMDFYNSLKADMELSGLNNPLVVVAITIAEWKELAAVNPSILPAPEGNDTDKVHMIRCGNNRYRIAAEMGYTLIDCIVTTMKEANKICHEQRNS